jgi:hypothetical protein
MGVVMGVFKSREIDDGETKTADVEVEGEIRDFVRRDVASLRRPDNESEVVANNIGTLLSRVAGSSVQEIDRLIGELQRVRDLLQNEGARVQREIVEFATLSQAAMQSTKVISDSLTTWKRVPDAPSMRHE